MAIAPFFERIYAAVGGHLAVSPESLNASLEKIIVGIKCGEGLSPNERCIVETATNLLARLYPRISIVGPERECSKLRELAFNINPNIEIVDRGPMATTIVVGARKGDGALLPSASGWVAHLSHSSPRPAGPFNPYSASAAAVLAVSELFRRIFLNAAPDRDISLSLLNFDSNTGADLELRPGNLGEVLFVGVGAVGNAALWALARDEQRQGRLHLIDPEELELSNLQRYVLGSATDVTRPKVHLAQETLAKTQISTEICFETLELFADAHGGVSIPTICISVDNVMSRRAAQALLPKLVVNGWTGDRALGTSWHLFSRDAACLACLYHPHGQGLSATEQAARALGLSPERAAILWVTRQPLSEDDFKAAAKALGAEEAALAPWRGKSLGDLYTDVICGAIPLNLSAVGRIETVPLAHQSAMAGILMAAELVKRTDENLASFLQTAPLVAWDDVLGPPPPVWSRPRPREAGCICGDAAYQEAYRKKWLPN